MAGDGTSATVFNNAGPNEDSIDVRAEGAALAGKQLFGLDLTIARILLVDVDGTMFTSTALPTSPVFVEDSEFQQTLVELVDPVTNEPTILEPGDAPYFLSVFDPLAHIAALQDEVREAPVSAGMVKDLLKPLEDAHARLGTLTQENVDEAAKELQKFIKIVEMHRAKKIPAPIADSLGAAAQQILDSLPRGCV
ncbi:hypothetical protein AU252_17645 [Pseudarthrobacter sulfonivorans]|uniref:Uncharacterized protein n=1 Tax=Pseudarthrobacter sulfonivorans TaxID=121292 RepID=A0A0U3RC16_9MICC|nr:hypothetical protein [Pseudarthrobacter sulfonivorans]ALV42753.1 hypothetical protein AU252_17645 [Pseudarthrobacter sulfonivorans]